MLDELAFDADCRRAAGLLSGLALGSRPGRRLAELGRRLWPSAVVAADSVAGGAGSCAAGCPYRRSGGRPGLAVRHGLAGGHLLVALHLHAHLWRIGGAIGGGSRVGAGGLSGWLLRRGCMVLQAFGKGVGCIVSDGLCCTLDAGRAGAWLALDRFSLGRRRLCPCGRSAGRAAALDWRLRHGVCGGLGCSLAGAAGLAYADQVGVAEIQAGPGICCGPGSGLGRAVVVA